jgi:hypothetical protein
MVPEIPTPLTRGILPRELLAYGNKFGETNVKDKTKAPDLPMKDHSETTTFYYKSVFRSHG